MRNLVLGIDPGNYRTGYAFLYKENGKILLFKSGIIKSPKVKPKNLGFIFNKMKVLIEENNPSEIALESSFFGKNPQTLIRLGEIRGIILLLSSIYNIPIFEYTPQQIKNTVTGYGWATKEDVYSMVKKMFKIDTESYDETDAVAVGYCHLLRKI